MRWIICILFFVHLSATPVDDLIPSTPEEIAPSPLIENIISPLSGQIVLAATDLHIRAAQDLSLTSIYLPPQVLTRYADKDSLDHFLLGQALSSQARKGWTLLPHLWAGFNAHSPYLQVPDPSGFVLEFSLHNGQGTLHTPSYGLSNLRQDHPNSTADLRN